MKAVEVQGERTQAPVHQHQGEAVLGAGRPRRSPVAGVLGEAPRGEQQRRAPEEPEARDALGVALGAAGIEVEPVGPRTEGGPCGDAQSQHVVREPRAAQGRVRRRFSDDFLEGAVSARNAPRRGVDSRLVANAARHERRDAVFAGQGEGVAPGRGRRQRGPELGERALGRRVAQPRSVGSVQVHERQAFPDQAAARRRRGDAVDPPAEERGRKQRPPLPLHQEEPDVAIFGGQPNPQRAGRGVVGLGQSQSERGVAQAAVGVAQASGEALAVQGHAPRGRVLVASDQVRTSRQDAQRGRHDPHAVVGGHQPGLRTLPRRQPVPGPDRGTGAVVASGAACRAACRVRERVGRRRGFAGFEGEPGAGRLGRKPRRGVEGDALDVPSVGVVGREIEPPGVGVHGGVGGAARDVGHLQERSGRLRGGRFRRGREEVGDSRAVGGPDHRRAVGRPERGRVHGPVAGQLREHLTGLGQDDDVHHGGGGPARGGDAPAVGRPARKRPVDGRVGRHEGNRLSRGRVHDHEGVGAAPLLHGDDLVARGRHVGVGDAQPARDALHGPVRACAVQIAGQAVGADELELREVQGAAGAPRQGSPGPGELRQRPRSRGGIARPSVRIDQANARLGHAVGLDEGQGASVLGRQGLKSSPAGVVHRLSLRDGDSVRQASDLGRVPRRGLLPPRVPAVGQGGAEGGARGGVQAERNPKVRSGTGEGAQRRLAVKLGHASQVPGAVDVGTVPRRPRRRASRDLVQRGQGALHGGGAEDHLLPRPPDPPGVGQLRLEVGGQSFAHPGGGRRGRKARPTARETAEDGPQHLARRADHVEVEGVNQLVRYDELQPVVEVRDAAAVHGRTREDRDLVVGERGGVAVGDVGVVGQEKLDRPGGRRAEAVDQERVGRLGVRARAARQGFQTCRVGDDEVVRRELAPVLVGGRRLGRGRECARKGGGDGQGNGGCGGCGHGFEYRSVSGRPDA